MSVVAAVAAVVIAPSVVTLEAPIPTVAVDEVVSAPNVVVLDATTPKVAVAEAKERWRSATGRMTGGKVHVCPTV